MFSYKWAILAWLLHLHSVDCCCSYSISVGDERIVRDATGIIENNSVAMNPSKVVVVLQPWFFPYAPLGKLYEIRIESQQVYGDYLPMSEHELYVDDEIVFVVGNTSEVINSLRQREGDLIAERSENRRKRQSGIARKQRKWAGGNLILAELPQI